MVTLGLESVLISDPNQSDFLAFGRDVIRRSTVGVAHSGLVILAVSGASVSAADMLLSAGFITGCAVGTSVAESITRLIILQILTKRNREGSNKNANVYLQWLLPSKLRTSDSLVMAMAGA